MTYCCIPFELPQPSTCTANLALKLFCIIIYMRDTNGHLLKEIPINDIYGLFVTGTFCLDNDLFQKLPFFFFHLKKMSYYRRSD